METILTPPKWYLVEIHNRDLDRLKLYRNQDNGRLVATLERYSRGRYNEITRQFDISQPEWCKLVMQYTP